MRHAKRQIPRYTADRDETAAIPRFDYAVNPNSAVGSKFRIPRELWTLDIIKRLLELKPFKRKHTFGIMQLLSEVPKSSAFPSRIFFLKLETQKIDKGQIGKHCKRRNINEGLNVNGIQTNCFPTAEYTAYQQ